MHHPKNADTAIEGLYTARMESPHHEPPDEEPTEKHSEEPAAYNSVSSGIHDNAQVVQSDAMPEIFALGQPAYPQRSPRPLSRTSSSARPMCP